MKLVTTTGDFYSYYSDKSIAAPLDAMPATGFSHLDLSMYSIVYPGSPWIEPGDGWKKEVEACAVKAAYYGQDFCQAHSPGGNPLREEGRESLILATKRSIEACGMLGIPHIAIHAGERAELSREQFRELNADFFKSLGDVAEKSGVDLLVENSSAVWNPHYYLMTGEEMAEFVDYVGMPRLKINWDTGHANVQGCDQYHDILAMGDRLKALHVHDNIGTGDSHMMPMTGTLNFDMLMKGLLAINYKGDFTFEAGNTFRASGCWPHYRQNVQSDDKLSRVPLKLQQKVMALMREVGIWMLESYGIQPE
ncbi:MAG: sugar phosphate isomerase/epimerase [Clostridia bacterium]|nr:sugar phosphate isomerase/epimerase [Clostridia bacterium]